MISELYKHSYDKDRLQNVPEHLRDVHKARKRVRGEEQGVMLPPSSHRRIEAPPVLWDENDENDEIANNVSEIVDDFGLNDDDLDGIDLS